MRSWYRIVPRGGLVALLCGLLAACQSLPGPSGFTPAQTRALRDAGFTPTTQGWELGMADRLLFATDESLILPEQAARIGRIANGLQAVGIRRLRVEGYTDSVGRSAYNDTLSSHRADAVADALAAGGLPRDGMTVVGLGERAPVESNRTAAGRAENRRVVIIIPAP